MIIKILSFAAPSVASRQFPECSKFSKFTVLKAEPKQLCRAVTHQVPEVIHAQPVGVEPHGGLQVVPVDKIQVLLPQFPAAQELILEKRGREKERQRGGVRPSGIPGIGSETSGLSFPPRSGSSSRGSSSTAPSAGPGCCPARPQRPGRRRRPAAGGPVSPPSHLQARV